MSALDNCINKLISSKVLTNAAIRAGKGREILIDSYFSHTDYELCEKTLFDMASVTKIVATTTLALIASDKGLLKFSDKVSQYFGVPDDKKELTVKNLLCHTMGMGHKNLCADGVTYGNIAEHILSIPCDVKIGIDYIYSCPAFILLGKILEKIYGKRLDALLREYVSDPLGMTDTGYLPDAENYRFAPCNFRGESYRVNDYNCDFLGGVAGNAGVFSNIADMTLFAQMLLSEGSPIIESKTFEQAVKNYGREKFSESRALGFLYVDKKYTQTGKLFPKGSFGHCGHTGQSVFVHPESGLYAIVLTDATATLARASGDLSYDYGIVCDMRKQIHNAIAEDIKNYI